MLFKKLGIAAAVLVGWGVAGTGLAAAQSPGVARRPTATAQGPDTARLSPKAAVIYRYVKMRKPEDFKWERVPWLTDIPEAIRQAAVENRPLLLWITADEPLERC